MQSARQGLVRARCPGPPFQSIFPLCSICLSGRSCLLAQRKRGYVNVLATTSVGTHTHIQKNKFFIDILFSARELKTSKWALRNQLDFVVLICEARQLLASKATQKDCMWSVCAASLAEFSATAVFSADASRTETILAVRNSRLRRNYRVCDP